MLSEPECEVGQDRQVGNLCLVHSWALGLGVQVLWMEVASSHPGLGRTWACALRPSALGSVPKSHSLAW